MLIRRFFLFIISLLFAINTFAADLIYTSGKVTGISGLDLGGSLGLYDISFDETWNGFVGSQLLEPARVALLNSILDNGQFSNLPFDLDPSLTFGCGPLLCEMHLAVANGGGGYNSTFIKNLANNIVDQNHFSQSGLASTLLGVNYSDQSGRVFANLSAHVPVTSVPEPAASWMLFLGVMMIYLYRFNVISIKALKV